MRGGDSDLLLLLYYSLHDELVKKFRVGGITNKFWLSHLFLGQQHHVRKNLREPILKEMMNLKLIKYSDEYGADAIEVLKSPLDLDNTSNIYRTLKFF